MNYRDIDCKIVNIEGFSLSSPYGMGDSLGQPLGVKSIGLVKVYTDSGVYGLGETYAGVYAPELIQPIVEFLKDRFVGCLVGDELSLDSAGDIPFVGGSGIFQSVYSAIEIAIWDIRGKILEVPSSHLMGNAVEKVPLYASSGTVVFSPDDISKDVDNITKLGYSSYKMRVGYQDWGSDLKRVESARLALECGELMVDAIMGTLRPAWSTKKAIQRSRDLEKFGVRWLEEPVHPSNINGLSEVRRNSNIPIAAGEAYTSQREYDAILGTQSVDVLQFDATHSGGISACLRLAEYSKKMGLDNALHVWGSAVAIAANLKTAVATPFVDIVEIPMVSLELSKHMWVQQPNIENGVYKADDIPGLGVYLNNSLLDTFKFKANSGYRLP